MTVSSRTEYLEQMPAWIGAYQHWQAEAIHPIRRVGYSLRDLAERGLINEFMFDAFCASTGLSDMYWRILWADMDNLPDDQSIANAIRCAEGVVVFLHGWDGSGEVWEDLPARVLQQNQRLVALVPDVNGFGGTPFTSELPTPEQCAPPGLMTAVERWLELLEIRSGHEADVHRPFVFVGHSMGGAALFFLDETRWDPYEVGRIASAPALLTNDRVRQGFYRALGAGIRISAWSDLADRLTEEVIAPAVIEALAGGASDFVRAEHHRVFRATPQGVIAQTFAAMGLLEADLPAGEWPHFHIFLAHQDRLVGLQPTLELLEQLEFWPEQIHIALGDHYFFSVGRSEKMHTRNRDLLIADILGLHRDLLEHQLTGERH
jgi:pimeloyl-ACP methyl ester carboxylesterase